MPEQVWAITRGSYSDYRVLAVFATKKAAKQAVNLAKNPYDGAEDFEEMIFYPEGIEPQRIRTYRVFVELWDDGREGEHKERVEEEWEYNMLWPHFNTARPFVRFVRAPIHKNKGGRLEVGGTDEVAVLKTVSDLVAQWKAQNYRLNERNK